MATFDVSANLVKVNLRICLAHVPGEGELPEWQAAFERASQVLFHAFDGQLQFGKLDVELATVFSSGCDVAIYESTGRSHSGALTMGICNDERNHPLVIVHEFGHFMFNLGDEYPEGCAPIESQACIMEFSGEGDLMSSGVIITSGKVAEFCSPNAPGKHIPGNSQQQRHGESCWETIQESFSKRTDVDFDFSIPDSNRSFSSSSPVGHQTTEWNILTTGSLYALVMDNSPNLAGQPFADGQRNGIEFWVDFTQLTGNQLAVISGNGATVFPMQKISSSVQVEQAFAAINQFPFTTAPNANQSLLEASNQVSPNGTRFVNQHIALLSSRNAQESEPNEEIIREIRSRGSKAHWLDVGSSKSRPQFSELVNQTGGQFVQINHGIEESLAAFELQNSLIELAFELTPGHGLVGVTGNQIPELLKSGGVDSTDQVEQQRHNHSENRSDLIQHKFLIEQSCQKVCFVLSQDQPGELELKLVDPNEKPIAASLQLGPSIVRDHYEVFAIENPVAGCWTVTAERKDRNLVDGGPPVRGRIYAYTYNPSLFTKVAVSQRRDEQVIDIATSVFHGQWLKNIEPPIVQIFSSGSDVLHGPPLIEKTLVNEKYRPKGTDQWVAVNEPTYLARIAVPRPGLYTAVIRFANVGLATACYLCCEGKEPDLTSSIPFVRVVRRQVLIQ